MIVSKITEYTVFESPDGGETVYARIPGSSERVKVNESNRVQELKQDMAENQLWQEIRKAAKTNTTLQEEMNRVILLYHLSKNNGEN